MSVGLPSHHWNVCFNLEIVQLPPSRRNELSYQPSCVDGRSASLLVVVMGTASTIGTHAYELVDRRRKRRDFSTHCVQGRVV